jgi:wyosine [tRNA(Phe)-imidazoG37] synthetase (radical SAM superfamily)
VPCVFGPVPSRRLGRSLGIDPLGSKTCSWNCVYCQLGRTTTLTTERREHVPTATVLEEVRTRLEAHEPAAIDWVSFVGSGETTLALNLGPLVRGVKALTTVPVAVLTNGSLLHRRDVQEDLLDADAVLASLDAGSPDVFRRLDRPLPALTFRQHVDGLASFRQVYSGRYWVQVMLVKGLNDSEQALADLAAAIERVQPDAVHVSVPTRPPTEPWVEALDADVVRRAEQAFGDRARVAVGASSAVVLSGDDVLGAVEQLVQRHPVAEDELLRALEHRRPGQARRLLALLQESGRARPIERSGRRFWTASKGRYVEG